MGTRRRLPCARILGVVRAASSSLLFPLRDSSAMTTLMGSQHCHTARGASVIQVIAYGCFPEHAMSINALSALRRPFLRARRLTDGAGRVAAPPQAGERGHARIVPAAARVPSSTSSFSRRLLITVWLRLSRANSYLLRRGKRIDARRGTSRRARGCSANSSVHRWSG